VNPARVIPLCTVLTLGLAGCGSSSHSASEVASRAPLSTTSATATTTAATTSDPGSSGTKTSASKTKATSKAKKASASTAGPVGTPTTPAHTSTVTLGGESARRKRLRTPNTETNVGPVPVAGSGSGSGKSSGTGTSTGTTPSAGLPTTVQVNGPTPISCLKAAGLDKVQATQPETWVGYIPANNSPIYVDGPYGSPTAADNAAASLQGVEVAEGAGVYEITAVQTAHPQFWVNAAAKCLDGTSD
jgi:hypothetical protein